VAKKKNATKTLRHKIAPKENGRMGERKNKNRGFKQLRVWQDAISLYVFIEINREITKQE